MNKMTVTRRLSVSPDGPISADTDDLVHLRQGDLDSACGPYCLVSALIALGKRRRDEILDWSSWKGSSREGKFRDALAKFGPLACNGTEAKELLWLTGIDKSRKLEAWHVNGAKSEIVKSIAKAINEDCLAIVGVRWSPQEGHWLLVVGYQGVETEGAIQLTHLLCLDPIQEAPRISLWNAVIEVYKSDGAAVNAGKLASTHWGLSGETDKCHIDSAIILKSPF